MKFLYVITCSALQEAQEIFGVDFDYADFAQEDEYDEDLEEEVCEYFLNLKLKL